jgi:hypothetical protein
MAYPTAGEPRSAALEKIQPAALPVVIFWNNILPYYQSGREYDCNKYSAIFQPGRPAAQEARTIRLIDF